MQRWLRRSASTSTSRSARSAAATATSTPTCPRRAARASPARSRRSSSWRARSSASAPRDTVFIGGGTPSLLDPGELRTILGAIELAPGAEVTQRGEPGERDARRGSRARARPASTGSRSACNPRAQHVLAELDRVHTPGRAAEAMADARAAGFERLSVDLIYGAHGETDDDWEASVRAALALEPEHVSAYALVVEPGTKLHARVRARRRARRPTTTRSRAATSAPTTCSREAGLAWYEISNWGEPAATTSATGAATTGGARARRALAHGRHALVEPQAPARLGGARARRRVARGGQRAPGR